MGAQISGQETLQEDDQNMETEGIRKSEYGRYIDREKYTVYTDFNAKTL